MLSSKNIFLPLAILALCLQARAQNCATDYYCNLIDNPSFSTHTGQACTNFTPFRTATGTHVNDWNQALRTNTVPRFNCTTNVARKFAVMGANRNGILHHADGIRQQLGVPLEAGKRYFMTIARRVDRSGSSTNGIMTIRFFNSQSTNFTGWATNRTINTFDIDTISSQQTLRETGIGGMVWNTFQICFTADSDWDVIMIHPEATSTQRTPRFWLAVDDIQLVNATPCAGPDTSFCTPTSQNITLGTPNCTTGLTGITRTFQWIRQPSTAVGTNSPTLAVTVSGGPTFYHLVSSINGMCSDTDVVSVCQSPQPSIDLGPDQDVCLPDSADLSFPLNPDWQYLWPGGSIPASNVYRHGYFNKSPETVVAGVMTQCGCADVDSMIVTFYPFTTDFLRDTAICSCHLPFRDTLPAGNTYVWNGGVAVSGFPNVRRFNNAGTFSVIITDPNGCIGYDTFTLTTFPNLPLNLGPDRHACIGESVEVCGPVGNYTYQWNGVTGARCTTVNVNSTLILRITIPGKSACCVGRDTINVQFHDTFHVHIDSLGPFCLNAAPHLLTTVPGHTTGVVTGPGVSAIQTGFIFDPASAGVGTHKIRWCATMPWPNGCTLCDSTEVMVVDYPKITFDFDTSLCITSPLRQLNFYPTGGIYRNYPGKVGLKGFNAMAAGVSCTGHAVRYVYTDPVTLCADSLDVNIVVRGTPDAAVSYSALPSSQCNGEPLTMTGYDANNPTCSNGLHYYWWPGGERSPSITVRKDGLYKLYLYTGDSLCRDSLIFTVGRMDCCALTPTIINDTVRTILTITDSTIVLQNSWHVAPGARLTLNNCRVVTKSCSRITVDRGGYLEADSTIFGLCDTGWKGIEVWGHPDACSDNFGFQGQFVGNYSIIEHAEVGLLAGRRPACPGTCKYFGSGTLWAEHCEFDSNFVDVMFTESNWGAMCEECDPPLTGGWQSHFWYNEFGQQRTLDFCGHYVEAELNTNYPGGTYINAGQPWLPCHIVDLNWWPMVWTVLSNPGAECGRRPDAALLNTAMDIDAHGNLIFNHNTYHLTRTCTSPTYR